LVKTRLTLRSPFGETYVRDVVDGRWAEPTGDADVSIGGGWWALPGLVDAHAHLAGNRIPNTVDPTSLEETAERAARALKDGVQLVFDKGWHDETVLDLIDNVSELERPYIEAAGRIIGVREGYFPGFTNEIEPVDLGDVVTFQCGGRATWVKLIGDWPRSGRGVLPNFTEEQLRSAVSGAESHGARVAIHTMAPDVASAAVAAGVHSIEHGLFLTEYDVVALGARGGMWVPTVRRIEETRSILRPGSTGDKMLADGLQNMRRLLPAAIQAGVIVLAGTDFASSTADVALEILRLAEFGVSPREAVRIGSINGYVAAGRPFDFGVGDPADVVLFPDNPVEKIEVLSHPTLVLRSGRIVE
jgi:imidazolonepropionase-like amidohydrolase